MAESALAAGDDEEAPYPPAAERFRKALERARLTASELARRSGVEETLYWDLELYDSEVFDCADIAHLPEIARLLQTPLMHLLFGEQPREMPALVSYAEVSARVREEAARRQGGIGALGDAVGWDLDDLVRDPEAIGQLNLVGLYDVCRAVGLDWVGVLAWAETNRSSEKTQHGRYT